MKRLILAACIGFLVTSTSWLRADPLSAEDLKRANDYLKKTSAAFLASVKGLSESQLNFKSDPTRWSVAQVAEHIAAAEDLLRGLIQEQVLKAGPRTEPANLKELDDFVLMAITDRSKKLQAPEPLQPTNRFNSTAGSVDHFKESRAKTIALLNSTKDLRDHALDSPMGKKLDAYEWLLFISAHCERHTKQIAEVKADPNFPKK